MDRRFFWPESWHRREPKLRSVRGLPSPGEKRALIKDEMKLLGLNLPALIEGKEDGSGFYVYARFPSRRIDYQLEADHLEALRVYRQSPNVRAESLRPIGDQETG